MKLALVYDRLNKLGGAEVVLSNLANLYPSAPWYTSIYNKEKTPFTSNWKITSSFLSNYKLFRDNHELVPFLMPYIFENFSFNDFDVVISISSAECKGVITGPQTLHFNYCLTPTRYLWSHQQEYLTSNQFGILQSLSRPIIKKLLASLKRWDYVAAQRPDVMIAISDHVKKRVKKYYNRDVDVIYPPVATKKFSVKSSHTPKDSNYYLTVSRLVPYKKLDLLITAFNKMGNKLIIIGVGLGRKRLSRIANSNIIFKGNVADDVLVGYYQNCRAFLQVNEEDFGIAMVEAQASGKPVIAFKKGGAAEIVRSDTGVLFAKQSSSAIIQAVNDFEKINFSKETCKNNAKRFDQDIFKKLFLEKVKQEWGKTKAI